MPGRQKQVEVEGAEITGDGLTTLSVRIEPLYGNKVEI